LGKGSIGRLSTSNPKSNMKALLTPFFGPGRTFSHGELHKKMPSTSIPNDIVVHSATSSDDEKTGCTRVERRAILASIKGKVVYNTLTKMVASETVDEPLLLEDTKGEDYGHGEEKEGSGPTMDEGFPDMEAQCNPFEKITELEEELATLKALVEEYKLKNQQLEEELVTHKNILSRLN
jgi:hypothetical protein